MAIMGPMSRPNDSRAAPRQAPRPASWLSCVVISLVLAGSSLSLGGCEKSGSSTPSQTSDAIDELTSELLDGLRAGDRDAVLGLANATLASDLDERDVAVIARTLTWLGVARTIDRGAEEPVAGGTRRSYRVEFDRGEVELTVTVVGAKLEGFEFAEGQWSALVDGAAAAAAGELAVVEFRYLDREGQPIDAPVDAASIDYLVGLEGLESQLREHHVVIDKAVFDGEGNQVYRQDHPDDIRFPQSEDGSAGANITGKVAVPGPGRYELELDIDDRVGNQTLTHRESFSIE